MKRAIIEKLYQPVHGYKYNVQIETSTDGGKTYLYCGNGRYFKTFEEAENYKNEINEGETRK